MARAVSMADTGTMILFVLWLILAVLSLPLAIIALLLYPFVWLISLPFRIVGISVKAVLETVKADPTLRRIPVIVLTTSSSDADIEGSYDRGANAFVTKPSDLAGWNDALERIERFWMELAALPEHRPADGPDPARS